LKAAAPAPDKERGRGGEKKMRSSRAIIVALIMCGMCSGQTTPGCSRSYQLVNQAVDSGQQGDISSAKLLLEEAVALCPEDYGALGNLGFIHAVTGEHGKAKSMLQRSLMGMPGSPEPWVNVGNVLKSEVDEEPVPVEEKNMSMVKRCYQTALRLEFNQIDALANMAGLAAMDRDWERTAAVATRSLGVGPTEEAFCALMKALDNICHWHHPMRDLKGLFRILEGKARAAMASPSYSMMSKMCYNAGTAALITDLPPELALLVARGEMAIVGSNVTRLPQMGPGWMVIPPGRRLKLAYVSGHFLDHPMMQMMRGMFRMHSRERVHVTCFATSPSDGSELRASAESSCEEFYDVSSLTDFEVSNAINAHSPNILLNLYGFLDKSRNAIAAAGPAPVQINHRWCSSTGAPWIHFHVSDRATSPPELRGLYTERLSLMARSYLVNDHRASYPPPPDAQPAARAPLPEPGDVVFGSLNNVYKLTDDLWAVWMHIMSTLPASRLMLLEARGSRRPNIRLNMHAKAAGVDPSRIHTLGSVGKLIHIGRSANISLFLDTWKVTHLPHHHYHYHHHHTATTNNNTTTTTIADSH
jgi:predicted O-linked N-acetylglucosamine transferase (SPINDLY family)